jgi:hypothetical protein
MKRRGPRPPEGLRGPSLNDSSALFQDGECGLRLALRSLHIASLACGLGLLDERGGLADVGWLLRSRQRARGLNLLPPRCLDFLAARRLDFLAARRLDFLPARRLDFLATGRLNLLPPRCLDLLAARGLDFLATRRLNLLPPRCLDFLAPGSR